MAAIYPVVLSVPLPYVFLEQLYHCYRFSYLPVRLNKTVCTEDVTVNSSFSFMITKSLRSTIYARTIFERWLLRLWMLLLWLSWTRWVWRHERVVADLLHFSMFLYNCTCIFYWLQVFNWRVVDCDLAIGLCTLLSKAEVFKILWKVIDNTWQNYDKILVGNMIAVL